MSCGILGVTPSGHLLRRLSMTSGCPVRCVLSKAIFARLGAMADLVEQLRALWATPVTDPHAAHAAFGQVYADPVLVNGAPMSLAALVARAIALQQAFSE